MDTQNDGLEEVTPFKKWPFLVSMLVFFGSVYAKKKQNNKNSIEPPKWDPNIPLMKFNTSPLKSYHFTQLGKAFTSSFRTKPTARPTTFVDRQFYVLQLRFFRVDIGFLEQVELRRLGKKHPKGSE